MLTAFFCLACELLYVLSSFGFFLLVFIACIEYSFPF